MARGTTHQKRVELGLWLEKLLSPKIKKWEIFPIIHDAIILLDVHLSLDKRDYFFQLIESFQPKEPQSLLHEIPVCYEEIITFLYNLYDLFSTVDNEYAKDSPDFEKIESLESEIIEYQKQIKWADLPEINFYENIPTGEDESFIGHLETLSLADSKTRKELTEEFRKNYSLQMAGYPLEKNPLISTHREKYQEEVLNNPKLTKFDKRIVRYARVHNSIGNVLSFLDERELISILLEKLKYQDKPWELFLSEFCHEEYNNLKFFEHKASGRRIRFLPRDLISAYNKINEYLYLKDHSLVLERTLLDGFIHPEMKKENDKSRYRNLPTDALISNIFFDFLLLGGQEYYGFCEYCDSFFVIDRKNRKKFCSDVCRTLNQRK